MKWKYENTEILQTKGGGAAALYTGTIGAGLKQP